MALQHEPKRRATLEICVDSIVSARNAQEAGADRVELCVSLIEGGITPSFGLIEATVRALRIPVYVLIRPRAGDFFYSDEEIECMLRDVEACSDLGAKGIVVGFLTASGSIDERLTGIFLERARKCKMDFTFHRAFDMVNDPTEALQVLLRLGVPRLLTSGCAADVVKGSDMIRTLCEAAGDKLSIMAGGGVTAANIAELVATTGIREVHGSARRVQPSGMVFRRKDLFMGGEKSNNVETEYTIKIADVATVEAMLIALR